MCIVNNLRFDIDVLQAICAIEDFGNVTRAANYLALSQSAVSHKIRRLELRLGYDLLTRRPGNSSFTEEGQRLLNYARRILSLHDEVLVSLTRTPLTGRIRLGMTEDTTGGGLARILGRFSRINPEVSVLTHVSQSRTLERELMQGEIDLAIMQLFKHEVKANDIILTEDKLHWVASYDFSPDKSRPISFLAFDDNCFYKDWALQNTHPNLFGLRVVLRCTSTAGIVSAVSSGLGVTLLNQRHLTPDMKIVDDQFGPSPPDIVYIVRIAKKSKSPTALSLAHEIEKENNARYINLQVA
ncbi:MAG: LysR family transcriptional regulator [Gammaproteobacteria bacterium]|nr:LysR family transcriptional regulator [Gammaproteobacteria bacterium]